jgi:diguanylate cyclase (GGDEF)-like protein
MMLRSPADPIPGPRRQPPMQTATPESIQTLADAGEVAVALAAARDAVTPLRGTARGRMLLALSSVAAMAGDAMDSLRAAVAARECFQAAATEAGDALAKDAARGGECDALNRVATALRLAGDHATAIATLEEAETLARSSGQPFRLAQVLRNIGICCSLVGRHHHAMACLDEAEALLRVHGSRSDQNGARVSAINARNRLSDSLPAGSAERLQTLQATLPEWQALADGSVGDVQRRVHVMARGNLAITLAELGRHVEAIAELQTLEPAYRALGMRPNEGLCVSKLGRSQLALGHAAAARDAFRRAVGLLDDAGSLDDLQEALEGLSSAEEACGDPAAALAALRRVREIERRKSDAAARAAVVQRELRIELARLSSQWARHATQDPLTGLANRRALELWLDTQLPRAEQGEPLTVLLMDLDHFKWVNDSFGHAIGDEVLRRVARLVERSCREGDLAVRYGGEEFVLALAGVPPDAALAVAERLRQAIAGEAWDALTAGLKVSASIGVAAAVEAPAAAALFSLADRRLYAAKFAGRDRVVALG